ncbi:MAG: tRNA guanosine(15) transglycosylase TgtA, partial [Candidatus Thermoplasmatota archaeon]|nr:tRNA guanosine(15) transglycosylase TgtA [Candidatus Thermoplasmatota archaeon]
MGRICEFTVNGRTAETPLLLPVINPNMMIITPKEMIEKFGIQALITNSYIIKKTPELREKALKDGVHKLIDFDGIIMTDSGTFQSHVYGDVEVKPEEIVEFQRAIGVDIGTPLDIFIEPNFTYDEAKEAVDETLRRIKMSTGIKKEMALSGPVQGGIYTDLRTYCAKELSKMDCAIYPVGGIVPLMENQRYSDLIEIIIAAKKGLDPSKPVHLFGCGHPMVFPIAALLGCDVFDSAAYAKYARDGRMIFEDGTRHIEDLEYSPCGCPVCSIHTIAEIKSALPEEKVRLMAEHNLHVTFGMIRKIKTAIREGTLWELAERTCRSHPTLLSALKRLEKHKDFLEKFEPANRTRAFFYTGPESSWRPTANRAAARVLERYEPKEICVWLDETQRPYSASYRAVAEEVHSICDASLIVRSPFGPAPLELDEAYPFGQSVFPEKLDCEAEKRAEELCKIFEEKNQKCKFIRWEGRKTLDELKALGKKGATEDPDVSRVKALADFQFGKGAAKAIFGDAQIEIRKSRSTGKIRTAFSNGEHVLSMRAEDGFFTLKIAGAKRLSAAFKTPALRVIVNKDSAEFNKQGKNIFPRFVVGCDENVRPGDDVIIVDENDDLAAVGKALMVGEEMRAFKSGVAVKVREGTQKQKKEDDLD